MNGDNSQQSEDNYVQKTVRNLEGMNARQVSADQGNDKPILCSSRDPKKNLAQIVYRNQSRAYLLGYIKGNVHYPLCIMETGFGPILGFSEYSVEPREVDIGGSSFSDCTISNNAGTRYLKVINNEVKLVETEQEAEHFNVVFHIPHDDGYLTCAIKLVNNQSFALKYVEEYDIVVKAEYVKGDSSFMFAMKPAGGQNSPRNA